MDSDPSLQYVAAGLLYLMWAGALLLTWASSQRSRARRHARRERRRVRRCHQSRALAVLASETCPEVHGQGDCILFVDDRGTVRVSVFWGLITYHRD